MKKSLVLAAAIAAAFAMPVQAAGLSCNPLDNTARILTAPTPNAIHPNWNGESAVGLSWTFVGTIAKSKRPRDEHYLMGDMYSPRGGLTDKHVFILAKEWTCSTDPARDPRNWKWDE